MITKHFLTDVNFYVRFFGMVQEVKVLIISMQNLKDYCRPYADVTYADAHRKEQGVA